MNGGISTQTYALSFQSRCHCISRVKNNSMIGKWTPLSRVGSERLVND